MMSYEPELQPDELQPEMKNLILLSYGCILKNSGTFKKNKNLNFFDDIIKKWWQFRIFL